MGNMPSQTPKDLNRVPPFADVNLYESDRVLREAVEREGGASAGKWLSEFGAVTGSAHALELGRRANENLPKLEPEGPNRPGNTVVTYDPSYHEIMGISMGQGLHSMVWDHLRDGGKPEPGIHVARAAGLYMAAQMESGHCCPVTMTHSAVPALGHQPNMLGAWLPKMLSRDYDPAFVPVSEKKSATIGMGMTEIQGGSDVRANVTRAEAINGGGPGEAYTITGHKFFMSAPMCDAFLVLAQAPGGLSCFLMPRFRPDGTINALDFVRLKDKLGNRSNASSEVEFHGAWAQLVGEEGRGIRTILEMVTLTRLDCVLSSAGLMRFGMAYAIHHCRHRIAFQKKLIDQPMMQRVLAGMALHVEAAVLVAFRLARAYDKSADERESAWQRLMTPAAKFWVCKTGPAFAYEAMECIGGNGYVEDATPLARVYREMPLNAIWEGSGNIMCLDVLRVVSREPDAVMAVLEDLADGANGEVRLKAMLERIKDLLAGPAELQRNGRALAGLLAELAAAVLMRRHAPAAISDAYMQARLSGEPARLFGSTKLDGDLRAIIDRVLPQH